MTALIRRWDFYFNSLTDLEDSRRLQLHAEIQHQERRIHVAGSASRLEQLKFV